MRSCALESDGVHVKDGASSCNARFNSMLMVSRDVVRSDVVRREQGRSSKSGNPRRPTGYHYSLGCLRVGWAGAWSLKVECLIVNAVCEAVRMSFCAVEGADAKVYASCCVFQRTYQ